METTRDLFDAHHDKSEGDIYATPRLITSLAECYFYHTMDIPGFGHVEGEWDLRKSAREYLGGADFGGKRVLEIGVASGFLSFYMESLGAEVVGYDLSEHQSWDIVPFAGYDHGKKVLERKAHIRRINNGYWLCHKAYNSNARMVYGTVYAIPQEIGAVDITTFGSILLHVRDPFLALQCALRLTRETVIITEIVPRRHLIPMMLRQLNVFRGIGDRIGLAPEIFSRFSDPSMIFLPRYWERSPWETWWRLNPGIIKRFIGILGFGRTDVTYHFQRYRGKLRPCFTVVGHRAKAG